MFDIPFFVNFLRATIRLAVPLGFAGVGEGLLERSGVLNIGLEGIMLIGALAGVIGAHFFASPWMGVLLAILAGLLVAAIEGIVCIFFHADEVVTGIAINTLGLGVTSFGYRAIFGVTSLAVTVPTFKDLPIPGLSKIPLIGPAFFSQPVLLYLLIVVAIVIWYIQKKTSWGLDIRASGEDPWVAEAEGANAYRIRFIAMLTTGVLTAAGGSFLSLYNLNLFFDQMTSGRGFVALAIVVVGQWSPLGILAASLMFGASDALGLALQARLGEGAPYQLMLMLPFLVTMIVLPLTGGRRNKTAPAALGQGYERGTGS